MSLLRLLGIAIWLGLPASAAPQDLDADGIPDRDDPCPVIAGDLCIESRGLESSAAPLEEIQAPGDMQLFPVYDVDFESPPHVVGLPATTGLGGAPRPWPSSHFVRFGHLSEIVAPGLGLDQHLLLDGRDQIRFALGFGIPVIASTLELRLVVREINQQFTVLADAPIANQVEFLPEGSITVITFVRIPGTRFSERFETPLGTWVADEPIDLRIRVDYVASQWAVQLNDQPEVQGVDFGPEFQGSRGYRLSFPVVTNAGGDVRVDDVLITLLGSRAPEPFPKDSDGDREADPDDRCPSTPPEAVVDDAGCALEQFCARVAIRHWLFCYGADWQNDEPLRFLPRDCRPNAQRTGCEVLSR